MVCFLGKHHRCNYVHPITLHNVFNSRRGVWKHENDSQNSDMDWQFLHDCVGELPISWCDLADCSHNDQKDILLFVPTLFHGFGYFIMFHDLVICFIHSFIDLQHPN